MGSAGVGVEDSEAAWEGEPVSEGGCVAVDEDDAPVEAVSLGDDDALDVMDIDAGTSLSTKRCLQIVTGSAMTTLSLNQTCCEKTSRLMSC